MKIFSPILKGTTTVAQGTTNLSGSFTGSLFGTAATASYADNFTVGGTLTAQTINVQIITSSIEFNTGSTRNGALSTNTHQFTGSVLMSGSLGIGTNSPSDFIDATSGVAIIAPSGRSGLSLGSTQGTADEILGRLSFTNTNSSNAGGKRLSYISGIRGTTNDSVYIEFGTANDGLGTQRMVISQTGNVGIGTSSPNDNLVIFGANIATNQNNGNVGIYSTNGYGSGIGGSIALGGYYNNSNYIGFGSIHGKKENGTIDNAYGYLAFLTRGSDGSTERMRITSGGSLLITKNNIIGANTTDGSDDGYLFLCSAGAAGASRGAFVQCFGNEYSGDSGVLQLCAGNTGAAGYINFRTGDGGDRMRITINGSIGAPTGTNIYNPSDIRLKQNISTTTYGLNTISLLNPVKFNWKGGFEPTEDGKDMLGFVAQEVQEVIPEAVELFGGDINLNGELITTPLRVNEKFIIPVLVKAIQELKSENDTLKEILQRNNIQ